MATYLTPDRNVKFVEMHYYLFSQMISDIGGTFSAIFGIIAGLMGIIHTSRWENNVLHSVFGKWEIDQQTVTLFKQRLSYYGLFNLHEQVNSLDTDLKN